MQILNNDDLVALSEEIVNSGENAFVILAHFKVNAVAQEVNEIKIDSVISSAMSGDYENLVNVIKANSILL